MRVVLALLFALPTARSTDLVVGTPEYTQALLKFNAEYGQFFRDYFGCPRSATVAAECTEGSGYTNYASWLKAAKLAAKVFPHQGG